MNDQDLHKLLEQLRTEIEGTQSIDDEGRELLRTLDRDIHALLTRAEGMRKPAKESVFRRLEEAIADMEASHPTLTALLDELLTALSKTGI